jgi:predicted Zn-dependent peptidase
MAQMTAVKQRGADRITFPGILRAQRNVIIVWILLIAMLVVVSVMTPIVGQSSFATEENAKNILVQATALGIISVGQTFVILTAGIDSRLGEYVRAKKGLAYAVHGVFAPNRQAGSFDASVDTALESTADAIEAMFKVFADLRGADVTGDELKETKLRVAGGMVMAMQTIQQQAGYRVEGILNDYPIDYYDTYPQKIDDVTADGVRQVADKYIRDDVMTVVVVAPAGQVVEQLKRLGNVEVVPMPSRRSTTRPATAPSTGNP